MMFTDLLMQVFFSLSGEFGLLQEVVAVVS
jgi:hypothetical protein